MSDFISFDEFIGHVPFGNPDDLDGDGLLDDNGQFGELPSYDLRPVSPLRDFDENTLERSKSNDDPFKPDDDDDELGLNFGDVTFYEYGQDGNVVPPGPSPTVDGVPKLVSVPIMQFQLHPPPIIDQYVIPAQFQPPPPPPFHSTSTPSSNPNKRKRNYPNKRKRPTGVNQPQPMTKTAYDVLLVERRKMHPKEIVELGLERGLMVKNGATPDESIAAQIRAVIKNGDGRFFRELPLPGKRGRNFYGLNQGVEFGWYRAERGPNEEKYKTGNKRKRDEDKTASKRVKRV